MLNPEDDRIEYGRELLPPEGFYFVRGVATTYSMDFETLLAALVPLVLRGDLESKELLSNPIAILQAVKKVIGRLVVFCEAGQIKVPTSSNKLISLIDEIIIPVALPESSRQFPSFHPKTWMIEYGNNEGERIWRFIVLSRNLTSDQSWDVAVSLEGKQNGGKYSAIRHLLPFYNYLHSLLPKDILNERQGRIVSELISSLRGVSFFCDKPFDSFDIYPMGIRGKIKKFDIFDKPFDELVIVSPFLTSNIIRKANGNSSKANRGSRILISRAEALLNLQHKDSFNFKKYILRVVTTETAYTNDLHAKIYLRRIGNKTELWLGSANATASGIDRNVELMICFSCHSRSLNTVKFLEDICGGNPEDKTSLLCEFLDVENCNTLDEEDEYRKSAELLIKKFCRVDMFGIVSPKDGKYCLRLRVKTKFEFNNLVLRPINMPENKIKIGGGEEYIFPDLIPLEDLSSLFVISVAYPRGKVERVIKIPINGIPKTRDEVVLNSVLSNHQALLKYIAMLLSSNPALEVRQFEQRGLRFTPKKEVNPLLGMLSGLYENMLYAVARYPERIYDVGEILSTISLDDEILGQYRLVYDRFAEIAKNRFRRGERDE